MTFFASTRKTGVATLRGCPASHVLKASAIEAVVAAAGRFDAATGRQASETPQGHARRYRIAIEQGRDVGDEAAGRSQQTAHQLPATVAVSAVRNGQNDGIGGPELANRGQRQA